MAGAGLLRESVDKGNLTLSIFLFRDRCFPQYFHRMISCGDILRIRPNTSALRISNCEWRIFSDEPIRNPQSEMHNLPGFGVACRASINMTGSRFLVEGSRMPSRAWSLEPPRPAFCKRRGGRTLNQSARGLFGRRSYNMNQSHK